MNEVKQNQEADSLAAFTGLIVLFAVLAVIFAVSTPGNSSAASVAAASVTALATEMPTLTTQPTSIPTATIVATEAATSIPSVTDSTSNQTSGDYPAELVAQGQTLFLTCSACHGPDGRGLPGLGKDLVTGEFVLTSTDAELVTFVMTGRPIWDPANTTGIDMPAKGGNPVLTEADISAIIAYLRSLQHQ